LQVEPGGYTPQGMPPSPTNTVNTSSGYSMSIQQQESEDKSFYAPCTNLVCAHLKACTGLALGSTKHGHFVSISNRDHRRRVTRFYAPILCGPHLKACTKPHFM
jgi:hypothetical protein